MADILDSKIKQPSNQTKKTTGFTNIQDIVRSNRQNRLGSTVQQGIQGTINKGQQDLSKSFDQFHQGAQQNAIGTAADQAFVQQQIANPNASEENVNRFAKFRGGYTGPMGLENQDQLMAQQQNLQGLAKSAAGEYGRRGLLQRFIAPDQYTQGEQRLDTLLLGKTGGQTLGQARRAANAFGQQINAAQQSAQSEAQGLQQQAQQFGQQVGQQLTGAQTAQEQDIQNRLIQQQNEAEAARAALRAIFAKPIPVETKPLPAGMVSTMPVGQQTNRPMITQEQFDLAKNVLDQAGLSNKMLYHPEYFTQSPEDIIGQGITTPTKESIATEADKARALALAKLSGQEPTLFSEASQVGGYDPLNFLDRQRMNDVLMESRAKYQEAIPYEKLMEVGPSFLGGQRWNKQESVKQGNAFLSAADQIAQTDPKLAQQYRDVGERLINYNYDGPRSYGGGSGPGAGYRNSLFYGPNTLLANTYTKALQRANELEKSYPGGTRVLSEAPLALLERLKQLIGK